jgi:lysophospholipase L1-like esterase
MAASLAISLGGAEAVLRLAAPDWLRARMRYVAVGDPAAGSDAALPLEYRNGRFVRFTPLAETELAHPEYRTRVSFDRWGARRGHGPAWTPVSGVLVLGDSFTFGVGVPDEDAWPVLWSRASGRPVLNLGVPGSTLTDQLSIVEARHQELGAPRYCLFAFFLGNDLAELVSRSTPSRRERERPGRVTEVLHRVNAWTYANPLVRQSYVLQLVRVAAVRVWNASRDTPVTDLAFASMRVDRTDESETIEALARATSALKEQASRLRYTPVVLLIPDRYHLHSTLRETRAREYGIPPSALDPARPARLVTNALHAAGIDVLDTSACVAAAGERAYYVQDGHLTRGGQARLASCAAALLDPLF